MKRFILFGLSLALLPCVALAQRFSLHEQADVRWVCAGIGLDEREALAKMETDADLKLVFAAGKRGEYLADVDVILSDHAGKRTALKFTAQAPICLIQAPAGRYRVEASYHDTKRSVTTTVAKGAGQPGLVVFRFPAGN